MSHFRLVYLVIQALFLILVVFVGLLCRRVDRLLVWATLPVLVALLFNLQVLTPYYSYKHQDLETGSTHLTLLHMNVLGTNQDSARAIQLIQATQPDILVLAEYNERWQQAFKQSGV